MLCLFVNVRAGRYSGSQFRADRYQLLANLSVSPSPGSSDTALAQPSERVCFPRRRT